MLNNVILIGRLTDEPKLRNLNSGQSVCTVVLAVSRSFKNSEGEYDTDFIPCVLWEGLASATNEYCKKGSLVAIKGRLAVKESSIIIQKEPEQRKSYRSLEVIAEKVSFLKL